MSGNEEFASAGEWELAPEITPVPSASVILLRGDPYEVLLLRRSQRSSFVPGAWVFPGGALDDHDQALAAMGRSDDRDLEALRICALRELLEEAGIWAGDPSTDFAAIRRRLLTGDARLDEVGAEIAAAASRLVWTARWITPVGIPKRFDTWFFLLAVPPETEGEIDGREAIDSAWLAPGEALERHRQGGMPMVLPTIRTLENIARFTSPGALIEARRSAEIRALLPVITVENGVKRVHIPGDNL
jgi:8-oxo-dGTP pyrophosphatase MutT (NUDIX family)